MRIVRLVGAKGRQVHESIEAVYVGLANLAEEFVSCAGWSFDLAHAGYVMRTKGNTKRPILRTFACWRISSA